jgi:dinuclear metal center YbgI/SA1388 family protein
MTVRDVYNYLDEISPFNTQDKSDNSGLIIGSENAEVEKILVCLDITRAVAEEAAEFGADLIIAHHPVIFNPLKRISPNDAPYLLIKRGINAIGFHTNHDIAKNGVTDLMLEKLGFPESGDVIEPVNRDGSGYGKITRLSKPVTAAELAEMCKAAFGCIVVKYVDGGKPISRVGLCSGAGNALVEAAAEKGCDAFVCGDVKWDRFVFAENCVLTLIDAGHFHTEDIMCAALRDKLRRKFPEIVAEKAENSKELCKYSF